MDNIDFKAFLDKLIKNWMIIVLCCIIGVSIAFIYSEFMATPMYASSVKMSVKESDWSDGVSVSGVQVTYEMIENCFVVLEDNVTFEKVAELVNEERDTEYTAGQIKNWVSYSRVGETVFFSVTARTPDPELSATVCNAVIAIAPELIVQYVANIPVVALDDARPNYNQISPNTTRNMVFGFLVALVLVCGVIFAVVFFDKTISGEETIKERYNLAVLGVVPYIAPKVR